MKFFKSSQVSKWKNKFFSPKYFSVCVKIKFLQFQIVFHCLSIYAQLYIQYTGNILWLSKLSFDSELLQECSNRRCYPALPLLHEPSHSEQPAAVSGSDTTSWTIMTFIPCYGTDTFLEQRLVQLAAVMDDNSHIDACWCLCILWALCD